MNMHALTIEAVENEIGPLEDWEFQCHSASLHLVRSGLLGDDARVARGTCPGVPGQHSWAVVGTYTYSPEAIVDITAWSYSSQYPRLYVATENFIHRPHGSGSIWNWGVPGCGSGPDIPLSVELSGHAEKFIRLVAEQNNRTWLDREGWISLVHAPVENWPASEIVEAMMKTPGLSALVPIDIAGMLTDLNPEGLYR